MITTPISIAFYQKSLLYVWFITTTEPQPPGSYISGVPQSSAISFLGDSFESTFFSWIFLFTAGHVSGILELISLITSKDATHFFFLEGVG